MSHFTRRVLLGALLPVLPLVTASAWADTWPSKPIKLIVPFPAGGPTDITMRQLADNAGKILGQPVIALTLCRQADLSPQAAEIRRLEARGEPGQRVLGRILIVAK